jgi:lipopolysaccharide exporter
MTDNNITTSKEKNLGEKTLSNILWSGMSFFLGKGVTFVVTVILARILLPEDFGLVSLGLIAINYLEIFNNFGISTALIYRQDNPEETANAAFYINMLIGVILLITGMAVAPWVGDFFSEPRLIDILRVLSINFLITSLGSIHASLLSKNLNFKKRVIPSIGKSISKGTVSIIMALMGYGVWSLVWGQVVGELVVAMLYWRAMPWLPRFNFSWGDTRPLLVYGWQIALVGLIGMVHKNIDYLLIGRRMDSTQLGYYTISFRLPELIIINIVSMIGQTVFPTYAKVQNDLIALRKGFLIVLKYVSLCTLPIGVGLSIISYEFIIVTYSERWLPAVPVMQVLALYATVYSLSYNAGDVYKSLGRPDILNKLGIVKLIITIPVLYVCAGYGIYWVAVGQFGTTIVLTMIRLAVVSRVLDIKTSAILQAIRPAVTGIIVMSIALLFLQRTLANIAPIGRLIILVAIGAVLYASTLWYVDRDSIQQAVGMIQKYTGKVQAS